MNLDSIRKEMLSQATAERAAHSQRFFKTGSGEYGEGDRFIGLTVPQVRSMVPHTDELSENEVISLLQSEWHEERLLALLIFIRRFKIARNDETSQRRWIDLYLTNTRWVNNWDLVDTSAPNLLGVWLLKRERTILDHLASSDSLWDQRIAVLSTQTLIRAGEFSDTLRLCLRFLTHPHDLMHKACGWMMREIGNRDESPLRSFLGAHSPAMPRTMPRTMLRYAIEKLPEQDRKRYLARKGFQTGSPAAQFSQRTEC